MNGGEVWSDTYEVFCGSTGLGLKAQSVKTVVGSNFRFAIAGGRAGDGQPFYLCKAYVVDPNIPETIYDSSFKCRIFLETFIIKFSIFYLNLL